MENCVYILLCRNGRYYIGSAKDLNIRFSQHQSGFVQSTKLLRPLQLVFFQSFPTIKIARQTEFRLKKFKNKNIIQKIINEGVIRVEFI